MIPWLSTEFGLSQFSNDPYLARKIYLDYLRQDWSESCQVNFHVGTLDGRILGKDTFTKQVLLEKEEILLPKSYTPHTVESVVNFVCNRYDRNYESLRGKSRNHYDCEARFAIIWLCVNLGICTITGISKLFNRDPTNYMRLLRQITDQKIITFELLRSEFLKHKKGDEISIVRS
jgi:hypothetical protein